MRSEQVIIQEAELYVKQELGSDRSGHDWWHIERVRKLAVRLAEAEGADRYICELAALLHDVADEKLNPSKEAGLLKVQQWMEQAGVEQSIITIVMTIISTMSYNGGINPPMETIEGKLVQDADRLDALGAMGIARTFTYSGAKGRAMHEPDRDFSNVGYRSDDQTSIQHFYDKLLKLRNLMNTEHARAIAESRHQCMEQFLEQFYKEWDAKDC